VSHGPNHEIAPVWAVAPSVERAIAALSEASGGHVTREQLRGLGLSANQIEHRLRRGSLIAVFRGIYAVGHLPTTWHDRALGALLACGPEALLGHSAASYIWAILTKAPKVLELTLPTDRRPRGLRIHVCRTLTPADSAVRDGLPVTSPALTLLQMAPRLEPKRLKRAVNDLRIQHLLTLEELADIVSRFPRHAGARRLRPLTEQDPGPTRSQLEDAFVNLIARYGLPQPKLNVKVAGYEVDAYFEDEGLIVELDGYTFHRTKDSFESDRARDARILATGIPTMRITYDRLTKRPQIEARLLKQALRGRRRQGP